MQGKAVEVVGEKLKGEIGVKDGGSNG